MSPRHAGPNQTPGTATNAGDKLNHTLQTAR
jgi:hypothetical protein